MVSRWVEVCSAGASMCVQMGAEPEMGGRDGRSEFLGEPSRVTAVLVAATEGGGFCATGRQIRASGRWRGLWVVGRPRAALVDDGGARWARAHGLWVGSCLWRRMGWTSEAACQWTGWALWRFTETAVEASAVTVERLLRESGIHRVALGAAGCSCCEVRCHRALIEVRAELAGHLSAGQLLETLLPCRKSEAGLWSTHSG